MTTHVFSYSGGAGSFGMVDRMLPQIDQTKDRVVLLFTDTKIEHEDLYRHLDLAEAYFGIPITRIAEGRTVWELFHDEGMIGNSQADLCSRKLKREPASAWLRENCDPADTIVYLGIDWTEKHRFEGRDGNGGARARYAREGWRCEAPLCHAPYVTKPWVLGQMERAGIARSSAYRLGFAHDNCGGFCVKAGIGHFEDFLAHRRESYLEHEEEERRFNARREIAGKSPVAIMRSRAGGVVTPLTMEALRHRIEGGGSPLTEDEKQEQGGCGCFVSDGLDEEDMALLG